MKKVRFDELAFFDLALGKQFYELQEQGLGEYFETCLLGDIAEPSRVHGVHPVKHGCYRKFASSFPFGIYYSDSPDLISVVAVLDLRMEPGILSGEVKSRLGKDR